MKYAERFGMVPQSWWGNTVSEMLQDLTQSARRQGYYEMPRMLIRETEEGFEVRAALPGYEPESIQAEVLGDFLTLRGDRKSLSPAEGARYIHRERRADHLEETIQLPARVDAGKVSARFADGILTVKLPRLAPEVPENIRIAIER